MTQLVSDNFTRADSGNLGASWTPNIHDSLGEFTIASNLAVISSTASDISEVFTDASWTGGNDHYSEATFNATHADGVGAGSGVSCREILTAATYYRLVGNASGWELGRISAGVFHSVGNGSSATFTAGDVIRLEVQGTTLRCLKNGTQFASFTDTNITTGKPGIAYSSASDTAADAAIRLWAAGDFSAGGGGVTLAQLENAMHRGMFRGMR